MAEKILTLVLNLAKDTARLERISTALGADDRINMIRIPGLAGRDLPRAARLALAFHEDWASKAGEIGCFLSHARAWEYAAVADSEFCLILEDDAIPNGLGRLTSSSLPKDFDLIFVNDRMCLGSRMDSPTLQVTYLPIIQSLPLLNERDGGVGGDGYIITPKGARKLLEAVSRDLFYGHVDWRMLRYCVNPEDLKGALANTFVANVITNHHNSFRFPAWGVLRAYCASTPLVHFGVMPSSRESMNGDVPENA